MRDPHKSRRKNGRTTLRNPRESSAQAAAAAKSLVKARAVERRRKRTPAQLAADKRNLALGTHRKAAPSAKQLAVEKKWEAAGAAAWKKGEASWIAKGRAAWARGAALWKARGAAAWRRHHGGHHGIGHSLRSKKARAPIGVHLASTTLRPKLTIPRLASKQVKFAQAITPQDPGQRTKWRRAHVHHFKKVLKPRRARKSNVLHWRARRRRTRSY